MPRPRKQAEQKRSRVIAFRVTEDEYAGIEHKARQAEIDIGDFARHAVLRKRKTKPPPAAPTNFEAVDQLRRLGVNFNQIARTLNSGGGLPSSFHSLCERVETLLGTLFAEYLGRGSPHR